jgi:ribosomal protein L17
MLEELYKFINFLEYKKLSASDDSKDEILKNFKTSLKEMQMIKEKKLQAKSADEFLDEL